MVDHSLGQHLFIGETDTITILADGFLGAGLGGLFLATWAAARYDRAMLELLPARHREVLVRRYGFLGDRAQSHDEIAARLGVGAGRSRQLEREALRWLRNIFGSARLAA